MAETLSPEQLKEALVELPGWALDGSHLRKTYTCKGFRTAMAVLQRLSYEAESLDHHPDWRNVYNRIEVSLTTHDADETVTGKDLELARRFEKALRTSGLAGGLRES